MKVFFRVIHGLITLYFGMCITYIYYSFFFHIRDTFLLIALFSVWSEFIVLYVFNKGQCPMFRLHEKFGDKKLFFELFMPRYYALKVIPIVSIITFVGSILLLLQQLEIF